MLYMDVTLFTCICVLLSIDIQEVYISIRDMTHIYSYIYIFDMIHVCIYIHATFFAHVFVYYGL